MGNQAGYSNQGGNFNVFLGEYAGYNNQNGTGNVALGYNAGGNMQTANYNTFLGYQAGLNSTGSNNIAIGYLANSASNSYTNTVVIGTSISPTASNQVRLGNSSTTTFFCQGAYTSRTGGTYQTLSVWSDGQIAYLSSSKRYKNSIKDMEDVN